MIVLLGLAGLAGLLGLSFARRRVVRRRLLRLRKPPTGSPGRSPRVFIALGAGLAVVAVIGHWWATPFGLATGVGVDQFLRRREPADVRAARLRAVTDLPLG